MKANTNIKYLKNLFLIALVFCTSSSVFGQDEEVEETKPKFTLSGSVDAYYRTNFLKPNWFCPWYG